MFDVPVVLFTFKRKDTVARIVDRLREIKPTKVYIISDGPRNDDEAPIILDARKSIEGYIDWDCEVVKNYTDVNLGVYNRIGEGAKWVFEKEEFAIFLEDDNLPDLTFFRFCEDLLIKYKNDTRVLWICGTNYLGEYIPEDNSSYMFTQHMLPCGWASWGWKFTKFYDGNLDLLKEKDIESRIQRQYLDKRLYRQDMDLFHKTKFTLTNNKRMASWDRQMAFSLRANNLYGIAPSRNQIENIGVDIHSVHGGNSFDIEMTRRFCGIKTLPIEFPIMHPKMLLKDIDFEKKTGKIILQPWLDRLKIRIASIIKPIIGLDRNDSFKSYLKSKGILSK